MLLCPNCHIQLKNIRQIAFPVNAPDSTQGLPGLWVDLPALSPLSLYLGPSPCFSETLHSNRSIKTDPGLDCNEMVDILLFVGLKNGLLVLILPQICPSKLDVLITHPPRMGGGWISARMFVILWKLSLQLIKMNVPRCY